MELGKLIMSFSMTHKITIIDDHAEKDLFSGIVGDISISLVNSKWIAISANPDTKVMQEHPEIAKYDLPYIIHVV